MNKQNKFLYSFVSMVLFLLLLTACTNDANDESEEETPDNDSALEMKNPDAADGEDIESDDAENNESDNKKDNTSENTEQEVSDNKESDILENYSAEEIEYARVWLQLGDNPETDRLNARHVPAGDPINSLDEESAEYPEDVTVLDGGRQPGVITYSSNGDGTINVYNIPPRWGNNAGEEALQNTYQKILEEVELVEVDTGNPEDVKKVIDAYLIME
ncbi:hypothetical protein [Oceanobacillus jeddahense]|uniref:Lipoprotein n=1 Tax=Oceanobacillus jeddahense TaxID=1462527 RepID=A0ABY5JXD2_9BACI|nr:hypothetical protein [Oceanobacillus jeddahense]UUI04784.1 hypothetical protein NP439_09170 [Oceanobacillus jeddahense]